MSSDTTIGQSASAGDGAGAIGAEAAEHERQFREILDFSPAALCIVDEDGRLLFHNARLRDIVGYGKDELDNIDTRASGTTSTSARVSSSNYERKAAKS